MAIGCGKSPPSPDLPWKIRLLISAYTFAMDVCLRSNATINRRLGNLLDRKSPSSNKPVNSVTSSDVTVDHFRNLWFRLYVPSAAADSKLPLIVYFHGGGFALCGADSTPYDDFCRGLASETLAVVASVNYRLSPEYRFPAQYVDGFDALKFMDSTKDDTFLSSNADLSRCFIAGDSAGGNIAHHVTVRAAENGFEKLKIIGMVLMQPFFGGEERTESELRLARAPMLNLDLTDWMWKAFLPEGSDRDHEAANVFGGGGSRSTDIAGLKFPATVMFVGGFDLLQDRQRRYYEGLKKCGKEVKLVEYPNGIHGFYGFPDLPETALLVTEVKDFIQKQSWE
ncbi:probable carboxylesterase 18 [Cornus florida]|uniref:probable carboxylesterase 18 n=1 Tax=Cornus florida TaxID=4283 RepID=UPI0028A1F526|nr:probable carboxylesterase 18 [Cornus florida]